LLLFSLFVVALGRAALALAAEELVLGALCGALLLAAAALFTLPWPHTFSYRGEVRHTGLWLNPNHAGLVLGSFCLGALAALLPSSPGADEPSLAHGRRPARTWTPTRVLAAALLVLAALGLLRTYSRGAMLATGAASLLLAGPSLARTTPPRHRPQLALAASLALSLSLAVFWFARDSHHPVLRRATSWSNPDDFSWRNRISTLGPASAAIREAPMIGHGWGQLEQRVAAWHAPLEMRDSRAHGLNGPVQVAGALGLPLAGLLLLAYAAAAAALLPGYRAGRVSAAFGLAWLLLHALGFVLQGSLPHPPTALLFWSGFLFLPTAHPQRRRTLNPSID
jgi:hypothetical protein